jgi:SAM-dependent methyltransferase
MNLDLACPRCRHELRIEGDGALCDSCAASYRGIRGILDLRIAEDEYVANAVDWAIASTLDAEFDRHDFRGLLERYYDLVGDVSPSRRRVQIAHIMSAPARADQWLAALGPRARMGPILDLGCGPGGFLASRAVEGREVVGLDIAMRWLILARKRLDEAGRGDVRLVCGCAEALPFADRGFSAIVAGDALEHVRDREATLAEAHRVLIPSGRFVGATPNRYSLGLEPHVGVWGVGFLPRGWMPRYVRLVSGADFRAIHTLGARGWRRLATRSPFGGVALVAPGLPVEVVEGFSGVKQRLARLYNRVVRTWIGQAAARAFGPLFHLVFERAEDSRPPANRAIRPRSRPSTTTA